MSSILGTDVSSVSEDIHIEDGLPRLHKPNYRETVLRCTIAILLTLCVLEGFARYTISIGHPNMGPTAEFDKAYVLAQKPATPGKQLIVVVGGSFSKRAVYSEYIEQQMAKAGYDVEVRNLATVACSVYEQLALLERATKSAGKPALVIADFRPLAFVSNYLKRTIDYEKVRFDESYTGRRCELAAKNDPLSKLQDFAESNSYLIGYRRTLRYTLMSWMSLLFDSEHFRFKRATRTDELEGQSPHGWSPVFEIMDSSELVEGKKGFEDRVKMVSDLCSPAPISWTDEYSLPLRNFCTKNNIPLMYVWEPVHPALSGIYEKAGVPLDGFKSRLEHLTKYPNVFAFDAHDIDPAGDHYKSIDHVNYRGALVFSEGLSEALESAPFNSFFHRTQIAGKPSAQPSQSE